MKVLTGLFRSVFLVVAAIVLLIAATEIPPPSVLGDGPTLEVTTSIAPVTNDEYQLLRRATPGMFRCSVMVIQGEPGNKIIVGKQEILIGPGEEDEQSAAFGPLQLTFHVNIAKSLDRARTTVTLRRDSKIITRQVSTVWLDRTNQEKARP